MEVRPPILGDRTLALLSERCCEVADEVIGVGGSETGGQVPSSRGEHSRDTCSELAIVCQSGDTCSSAQVLGHYVVEVSRRQFVEQRVEVAYWTLALASSQLVGQGD